MHGLHFRECYLLKVLNIDIDLWIHKINLYIEIGGMQARQKPAYHRRMSDERQ